MEYTVVAQWDGKLCFIPMTYVYEQCTGLGQKQKMKSLDQNVRCLSFALPSGLQ